MGIDQQVLHFLLLSKDCGVSFESFLMIGRQSFHSLKARDLRSELLQHGISLTAEETAALLQVRGGFVEPLLELLGAKSVESLDSSPYEQASVICDLNSPVPENLVEAFSCVFDGGSIEHVFDFPRAIKNCMEMISIGGHLLTVTSANNFMGHGFYQFSPELYYRVLSEQNGFLIEEMAICEIDRNSPWYSVADPKNLGRRVELVNGRPTYLMVRARKLRRAEIFSVPPNQSDYAAMWSANPSGPSATTSVPLTIRGFIPDAVKKRLRRFLGHRTPGAFRRIR